MKKIIILILASILIAGCTQQGNNIDLSGLKELGNLPIINASGMNELGSLPFTNISIDLNTGIPANNPFPSQPEIE